MKTLLKTLIFVVITMPVISFAQTDTSLNSDYKTFSSTCKLEFTENAESKVLILNSNSILPKNDKCHSFTKMKNAGIAISITGVVFIGTGIALFKVYDYEHQINFGGVFTTVLGIGAAVAGIPLIIIGAVKSKKHCNNKYNPEMIICTNENGISAKLVF